MPIHRRPGDGPSNGLLILISAVMLATVAVGIWAVVTGRIGGP